MKGELLVTDLTRMFGNRVCVAGYVSGVGCVRPLDWHGYHLEESWLSVGERYIRPFDVVEIDLLEHRPDPPHTEDWITNPASRRYVRSVGAAERPKWLVAHDDRAVDQIFGTLVHRDHGSYVTEGEGNRSLGTVGISRLDRVMYDAEYGDWEYRLAFADGFGQHYRLAVTDLAFRYYLDHLRVREGLSAPAAAQRVFRELASADWVYLRVGLARHWKKFPDRCYLQITGVYSYPDYLGGRCFADLALSDEELDARRTAPDPDGTVALDDLPF